MILGINPCVDYAFKKLFGSEPNVPILVHFLNAVLNPVRRLVELRLLNPFNEKDALDDKLSILDIKVRDEVGQQYNVEMQMFGSLVQLQRILYYWAGLHSDQLSEGQKYAELRATITVAIVNTTLFPSVPDYHLDFQLRSSAHPHLIFCPQQVIHVLELPKFSKNANELADPLDVWCYFLQHAAEIDDLNPPSAFKTPIVEKAMEVLKMLSQNDVERERYKARLKWERDQAAFVDEARQEGHQQGREEGHLAGAWIGRIQLLQELLKQPVTSKSDLASLSLEQLQEKAETLQKHLPTASK